MTPTLGPSPERDPNYLTYMSPKEQALADAILDAATESVATDAKRTRILVASYVHLTQSNRPSPFEAMLSGCCGGGNNEDAAPADNVQTTTPVATTTTTRAKRGAAKAETPAVVTPAAETPAPAAAPVTPAGPSASDLLGDTTPVETYEQKFNRLKDVFLKKDKTNADVSAEASDNFRAKVGSIVASLGGTKLSDVPQDKIDELFASIVNA